MLHHVHTEIWALLLTAAALLSAPRSGNDVGPVDTDYVPPPEEQAFIAERQRARLDPADWIREEEEKIRSGENEFREESEEY